MDMNALAARISAKRSAAGLTLWFVGPTFGEAVSIACANEEQKAGYLASMRAKGRVILSDSGKAGLAAKYIELIGYDPFEDSPDIGEAEVAGILADYIKEMVA